MTFIDQDEDMNSDTEQSLSSQSTQQDWEDYEKKYKALLPDYTRKTQELAELKKSKSNSSTSWDDDDDEQIDNYLRKRWFVTKEELEGFKRQEQNSNELKWLVSSFPELRKYEKAITELQNTTWLSVNDIVKDYGFIDSAKLDLAKERDIKWVRFESKSKWILDMSKKEYEEFKKANKIGYGWTFYN